MKTGEKGRYTTEIVRKVWDDDTGDRFIIGPDRDGVGSVEVQFIFNNGDDGPFMVFPPKWSKLVASAMLLCADEIMAADKHGKESES